jgi:hypothetical protein
MRRPYAAAAILLICALPAVAGGAYGAKLSLEKATPVAEILDDPHGHEGKLVQVTGPIAEVCSHKGCWMTIKAEDGRTLMAKSSGDAITIPTDSAGKLVVVEGVVVVEHPDKTGHAEAEAGGHDCPSPKIRLETKGILLK